MKTLTQTQIKTLNALYFKRFNKILEELEEKLEKELGEDWKELDSGYDKIENVNGGYRLSNFTFSYSEIFENFKEILEKELDSYLSDFDFEELYDGCEHYDDFEDFKDSYESNLENFMEYENYTVFEMFMNSIYEHTINKF